MRRYLLFVLLFTIVNAANAQLQYPVVGTYQNKSAQGMAIYDDKAYLMNEGGSCRVLNLLTGKVERSFFVCSAAKDNHCNSACFGKNCGDEDGMPLLYISECYNSGRCFVERLTENSSVTVQTIEATKNGKNWRMSNWVLDNKNGYLYALTRNRKEHIDSVGNVRCYVIKYRIPSLVEGAYVRFSEKDIIDKFELIYPNVLQGSKIRKNKLFLVTGLQQSIVNKESKRAILVVDLAKKEIIKSVDLTYLTTNEPEDIDFFGKKCLLYCGQEGGIYEIKL